MDKLSLKEQDVLSELVNPDSVSSEKYQLDESLQREIVGLLMNDRYFVVQSQGLIKSDYFSNDCHKYVARIIFDHFGKYKVLPTRSQIHQELSDKIKNRDPKIKVYFLGELTTISEYYIPGIESRDYYLDKITSFAKTMSLKTCFSECLEEMKKNTDSEEIWSKIEAKIRDALAVDRNFEIGLDYFQDYEARYERMQRKLETGDYFVTGFKDIDDAFSGGGIGRGEIGSVMGLSGSGKSIFLVNAAIANLNRGKKVLYVSLEIDSDKCAERFDAQFANPEPFGSSSNGISVKNLYEHKEDIFKSLEDYIKDAADPRLLVVKQFPAGSMSMSDLRAYFAQIKLSGFMPDLLILDYVGEMQDYPGMPTWESRQKLVRDSRRLAVEEQIGVFTAMQPDGKAREVVKLNGVIDESNLAESKGQIRPLDALWSINQLDEEKECGLARVYVIKHRDGKSRFIVHVEFNYDTLKMRQISENKYKTIYSKYKNEKTGTVTQAMREAEAEKIMSGKKKPQIQFKDAGYQDVEDAPVGNIEL